MNNNVIKSPKVGVGVMIIKNGKVLLGRRKGKHGANSYGWIGGHLEFGETFEQCLIREAQEEADLKIEPKKLKFLCLNNIIAYDEHYVDIEFFTEIKNKEPKVMETNRVEKWGWYDLDKLPSPMLKAVELAIKKYKAKNRK